MSGASTRAELAEAIAQAMPPLDGSKQRIALAVYHVLAKGKPLEHQEIARRTGLEETQISETLSAWPGVFRNDDDRIVGFWGLALSETPHRFEVEGTRIYTWCAWDPLFIAPLLAKPARVTSEDPITGARVSLRVTQEGVESLSPTGAVVSFLVPDKPWDEAVIQRFCHYVLFFASRESGDKWVAAHPGTFLLSIDDAFDVGRRTNAAQFGDSLATPAGKPSNPRVTT